ncbi:mitochondrial 54S ribosomal protein bL21m [Kwoniella dejecticola CBS 10117]|uniref:Large ribosomal subunit protein bL21m n=1 Tax=Kwoniella dejecticola CBS 10117 TaxID=1296121 RepID=A0A1A5ZU42_9TREE|nr:uncharacterized protein I303_08719 [Kwoniella dejecticola CBS 10117]OBR81332.1 hypothetical protein I303_08719 [Kwoniella dejecticola CBS 10117]
MARPNISSAFARLSLSRGLQTTAPLPPPSTPLPPSDATASSSSSSTSTSSALSHLPPLLPSTSSSSSSVAQPSSTSSALDLIASQSTTSSGRYVIARLYSRNYLLHPKDILTIPQLKPAQSPGSTLSLTKILEVGSRDYSIRSQASNAAILKRSMDWKEKRLTTFDSIPPAVVSCQLTVLEHTKSPLERILKKKRRKGYKKTIEHKQGYTRLRVGDIILGDSASPSTQEI